VPVPAPFCFRRLRLGTLVLCLPLSCAPEQGLIAKDTDVPSGDSAPPVEDSAPPAEICNGLDDDGDGSVDEGFPDDDANGRVDCLDVTCPTLLVGVSGAIAPDEACAAEIYVPPLDPWDIEVEWSYTAESLKCVDTPVVGHLDDDNGDGRIGDGDHPDIVIYGIYDGLRVLDGVTRTEKWRWDDGQPAGGHAPALIADVDGDGGPDVLTSEYLGREAVRLVLLDASGVPKWRSDYILPERHHGSVPVLADLDGDGLPEILVQDAVLSGVTGARLFALPTSGVRAIVLPLTADLDLDGTPEILVDGIVADAHGNELWNTGDLRGDRSTPEMQALWMAAVQADDDPEAEVASIGSTFSLFDTDGTPLFSVEVTSDYHREGPPCAGDLDGDGAVDIAWPASDKLVAFRLDGTELWQTPITDFSGLAGCSMFDVDGDGALDVLYASEDTFAIYDGPTGATVFEDVHFSATMVEYPTVADLDGDGDAEILVCGGPLDVPSLNVYGHFDDAWPPVGDTWPTHDWPAVDISEGGAVASAPPAFWNDPGMFRGRPYDLTPARADLTIAITDVCVADCQYGPIQVALQVANAGYVDAAEGAMAAVYAVEEDGWREVARIALPAVPAGTALAGITLDLAVGDVGAFGLGARVDPDGQVTECDEENDVTMAAPACE
jgi:hypothetical protein